MSEAEKNDLKNIFLEAYEKYADAIYRYCFFRVFSRGRAEELMQETFMKTWRYLSDGKHVDNMRAFVYRIATNLIIDDSRKKKEESLDAALEQSDAFEPSYDGAAEIEAQVMFKEIVRAMDHLEEGERRVLTLRYLEDLNPRDIAEILGISANNASVKISRALRKLKKYFKN